MPRRAALRRGGQSPGFDGKREIAPALIESPYTKGSFDAVVINLRESQLSTMRARGQIDDAQLEAGNWFRKTYEKTRMGSMAVDPSREPVDTSGRADPIPDAMIAASKLLAAARVEIGKKPYNLVERVCGEGFCLRECLHLGRSEAGVGWRLRNALDDLAEWCGIRHTKEMI